MARHSYLHNTSSRLQSVLSVCLCCLYTVSTVLLLVDTVLVLSGLSVLSSSVTSTVVEQTSLERFCCLRAAIPRLCDNVGVCAYGKNVGKPVLRSYSFWRRSCWDPCNRGHSKMKLKKRHACALCAPRWLAAPRLCTLNGCGSSESCKPGLCTEGSRTGQRWRFALPPVTVRAVTINRALYSLKIVSNPSCTMNIWCPPHSRIPCVALALHLSRCVRTHVQLLPSSPPQGPM